MDDATRAAAPTSFDVALNPLNAGGTRTLLGPFNKPGSFTAALLPCGPDLALLESLMSATTTEDKLATMASVPPHHSVDIISNESSTCAS